MRQQWVAGKPHWGNKIIQHCRMCAAAIETQENANSSPGRAAATHNKQHAVNYAPLYAPPANNATFPTDAAAR
jgi:hypothetical protein